MGIMQIDSVRRVRKRRSRDAIIAAAAAHLRRFGPVTPSLKEITSDAGLTVGGFYNHFGSKNELIAAALHHAMSQRQGFVAKTLRGLRGRDRLEAWLRDYLTENHRDALQDGCPIAATISEATHAGDIFRRAMANEVSKSIQGLAHWIDPDVSPDSFAVAARTLALAAGTLQLARATADDPQLSTAILNAGKRALPS